MEVLATIISLVQGLFSGKIDNSRNQKVFIWKNNGAISLKDESGKQSVGSSVGNVSNGDGNTQNMTINNIIPEKKNPLNALRSWMSDLEKGEYKTHAEVVNLFCRHVIPFIQSHPDLQVIVDGWRTKYQSAVLESERLQKEVLQDSERTFREIVREAGEISEPTKRIIADIEELLTGDRRNVGYSSWPLYFEVYSKVKDLLRMLLALGKHDLCSCYAIIGTTRKYISTEEGGHYNVEPYIVEFTFAPSVQKAIDSEEAFDSKHVQEPFLVWKYFETALHFWEVKDVDIEQALNSLFKTHPFKALGTRGAWIEIAQVKRLDENKEEPHVFKRALFIKGLRTLINDIRTYLKPD